MQWLRDWGYRGVTLSEGLAWLNQTPSSAGTLTSDLRPLASEKLVALTFDDGFQDFCDQAYPVLHEFGFTATMFLPTAFIGATRRHFTPAGRSQLPTPNSQLQARSADSNLRALTPGLMESSVVRAPRACLTWTEVRELRRQGIRFGSHTVTHPKLRELPWRQVEEELRESKREIEARLGEQITTFAHPYAYPQTDRNYTRSFKELLCRTGYTCNATTEIGRFSCQDDPYRLKRVPINGDDDLALFQAKLEGAYDWLAAAQGFSKSLRGLWASRPSTAVPSGSRAGVNQEA